MKKIIATLIVLLAMLLALVPALAEDTTVLGYLNIFATSNGIFSLDTATELPVDSFYPVWVNETPDWTRVFDADGFVLMEEEYDSTVRENMVHFTVAKIFTKINGVWCEMLHSDANMNGVEDTIELLNSYEGGTVRKNGKEFLSHVEDEDLVNVHDEAYLCELYQVNPKVRTVAKVDYNRKTGLYTFVRKGQPIPGPQHFIAEDVPDFVEPEQPSEQPTVQPTPKPTPTPTSTPTEKPTEQPTEKPTEKPDEDTHFTIEPDPDEEDTDFTIGGDPQDEDTDFTIGGDSDKETTDFTIGGDSNETTDFTIGNESVESSTENTDFTISGETQENTDFTIQAAPVMVEAPVVVEEIGNDFSIGSSAPAVETKSTTDFSIQAEPEAVVVEAPVEAPVVEEIGNDFSIGSSAPVVEEPVATAVEATGFSIEAEPVVEVASEEAPVAEVSPIVFASPAAAEIGNDFSIGNGTETFVEESSPVVESAPIEEAPAIIEEAPVFVDAAPAVEEIGNDFSIGNGTETYVEESAPVVESAPIEEAPATVEEAPVIVVEAPAPVEEVVEPVVEETVDEDTGFSI